MESTQSSTKLGIKIERPGGEKLGFIYLLLAILALLFALSTLALLALEWTGQPLPAFLKLPIG